MNSMHSLDDRHYLFRAHYDPGSPSRRDFPPDLSHPHEKKLGSKKLHSTYVEKLKSRSSSLLSSRLFLGLDKSKGDSERDIPLREESASRLRRYSYDELLRATATFDVARVLGRGAAGTVYRGLLKLERDDELDGQPTEVAIKDYKTRRTSRGRSYTTEIEILSSLHHRNILKLLGWCHEARHLLIVYEFMPNNSLHSHLRPPSTHPWKPLPWEVRYSKIAMGLVSALLYLHTGCERCILHMNIKSRNVLLDHEFNPNLADFELARMVECDQNGEDFDTTVVVGTSGYMAPEYVTEGKIGKESDIYSLGVVALEIACGREAIEFVNEGDTEHFALVEWVRDLHTKGSILKAADPRLDNAFNSDEMERLLLVGLWCTCNNPDLRPSIDVIHQVLTFEAPMPSFTGDMFRRPLNSFPAPKQSVLLYSLSNISNTQTVCFELPATMNKDIPTTGASPSTMLIVGQHNSLAQSAQTFDIGIPPDYEAGLMKNHHQPIMDGMERSLRRMLTRGDKPLCFDEVFDSIRKYTAFLVSIGVPLRGWDEHAQAVLRTLKKMPDFFDHAETEVTAGKALSSLDIDMQMLSCRINEDASELEIIQEHLTDARKGRDFLMAVCSDIQKQIEEAEECCSFIEEELEFIDQRRIQQQLLLDQKKRQHEDIQSIQKFLF